MATRANSRLASTDGPPPHSEAAEQEVLGALLRHSGADDQRRAIDEAVALGLRAEQFYSVANQTIFHALLALDERTGAIDAASLAEELKRLEQIDNVGGYPYLGKLLEAAPTGAHLRQHIATVQEKAQLRDLARTGAELHAAAWHPAADPDECLDLADQSLLRISEATAQAGPEPASAHRNEVFQRIDECHAGTARGLNTGFADVDRVTAGLHRSELVVLAARSSVGKSSFGLGIARHVAAVEQHAVLFVSLEMRAVELLERLYCLQASVNGHALRKGQVGSEEIGRLLQAASFFDQSRLFIDETHSQSVRRIAANARMLKRREGLRLVIVDYLQLVKPEERRAPRHEQVGQISRQLKILARELDICVLLMAQLNREPDRRTDHRPRPSDLRESGEIEQNADAVYLLHRPELYREEGKPVEREGEADFIVGKSRHGPTDTVPMLFEKEFMRFADLKVDVPPEFA